jgi:hypothetical protein
MAESTNPLVAFSDHAAQLVERTARGIVAVHGGGRGSSSGIQWRSGVIITAEEVLERDEVILERCRWDGIKRAVKRRLRQRCPSDPEDELDWKAGRLWPAMASSIEPAEIEVETFLHRQPDLDSIARRDATALRRRDAALRHIEQRRSRRKKEEAQSQKIAATRSMNGKGEGPVVEPTALEELPIAADRNHQNGHG